MAAAAVVMRRSDDLEGMTGRRGSAWHRAWGISARGALRFALGDLGPARARFGGLQAMGRERTARTRARGRSVAWRGVWVCGGFSSGLSHAHTHPPHTRISPISHTARRVSCGIGMCTACSLPFVSRFFGFADCAEFAVWPGARVTANAAAASRPGPPPRARLGSALP